MDNIYNRYNNISAYWELFEKVFPRCFSFAYALTKSEAAAESIAHNVLQRLWSVQGESQEPQSVETLLLGLLRSELTLHFASASTGSGSSKRKMPLNKRGGNGTMVTDKSVEGMPAKRKEIFLLSRRSGLSNAEIAQQMGISVRTVEKHIELAVKQLEQNANDTEANKSEVDRIASLKRHIAASPRSTKCLSNDWLAKNLSSSALDDMLMSEFASVALRPCEEQRERARESVEQIVSYSVPTPVAEPKSEVGAEGSTSNHKADSTQQGNRRNNSSRSWGVGLSWAASLVATVALAVMITLGQRPAPIEWTIVRTEATEQREVKMPDGSTIWLNGDSEILYPSRFEGESRKVYASGELYADIVKNPEVPFVVDADEVCAKVYGTKFNMKAHSDSRNVEIALVEGAVTMQVGDIGKDYILRPGDIVRYNKEVKTIETYRFKPFNYATWKDNGNLYFVNMNLGDIVKELEHRFGCSIIIGDSSLEELRYYASFVNNEGVDEILRALNARRNMRIIHTDGRIILTKR